jgi:hypothetical protein
LNEEYKKQLYKKWLEKGRPWFDIDKSKEPTYFEKQVIMEIKKRESEKLKRDGLNDNEKELEKRTKEIMEKYRGKISDKIFDTVSKELGDY